MQSFRHSNEQQGSVSKSQAASPSLDLPKGGGALRGIDEKFQSNPATGSATFSIPLPLSPSRGFEPELSLSYDSGSGNSPFGLGWSLSVPNISRKTDKGLPRYLDSNESDVFILSGFEDLVPCGDEREDGGYKIRLYRPRIESGFARIERLTDAEGISHWRTISADNVTRIYGESPAGRVCNPSNEKRIFQWFLEFSYDGRGNATSYVYESDSASRYLKKVFYGNAGHYAADTSHPVDWHFELEFEYGSRPDPFSSYRSGFDVRFSRRCERVLMRHNFDCECLVRSVEFEYAQGDSGISLLSKARQTGYMSDGAFKSLPAMSFAYQCCEWSGRVRSVDSDSLRGLPAGLASDGANLLDLYGDGLPGVLLEHGRGWYYKRNFGSGKLGSPAALKSRPLTGSAAGIQELEGDSEKYLVDYAGDAPGFYRFENGKAWAPHQTFRRLPNIDFNSPRVRTLDLDGDGRADILVDDGTSFLYYRSEGKEGFKLESRIYKPKDEDKGPRIVFADFEHSIFLADMSGDGLSDIARVRNGSVCYWPNLGHGKFGAKVAMRGSPLMDYKDIFNAERVRLADIDGTGTADLLYISGGKITAWLNKSGNGFSGKREFSLPCDSMSHVTVTDFLGAGTACIVWSSPLPSHVRSPMRYIDLMGGKKPYLMTKYSNGMGKTVELEYTPSTKFCLEDRKAGKPWVTRLPFPVHCLSKVTTQDQVSGHTFASSYSYRHGYYDIPEREFRGFGRVDRIDAESFGNELDQHPVLTKTWSHLGTPGRDSVISKQYEKEYWNGGIDGFSLPDSVLPAQLSAPERREAMRALKGMPLREEVYALDGSELENVPYATAQFSYEVKRLQPKGENRHACFIAAQSESLMHSYERNTEDPRVAHSLVLEFDEPYMRPIILAEAVYGRKAAGEPEQKKKHVVITETQYAGDISTTDAFRMGLECASKTWEIEASGVPSLFARESLLNKFSSAIAVPFEAEMSAGQKRLVESAETLFYNDDLTGKLNLGSMAAHGLPYETYSLAYTQSLLEHIYGQGRIDPAMLTEGGFEGFAN